LLTSLGERVANAIDSMQLRLPAKKTQKCAGLEWTRAYKAATIAGCKTVRIRASKRKESIMGDKGGKKDKDKSKKQNAIKKEQAAKGKKPTK
jgi:hypothetical protein